jgi:ABC-type polysaccharide/polyol phosphate export permease
MKQQIKHILFHRHLVMEFLRRDLQARYTGSVMGFFWSVIIPLVYFSIYFVIFGFLFKQKVQLYGWPEDRPGGFAFYIFSGLLPWYALQESWVRSTTCIVDNSHLIKQIRFPAKVLPAYLGLSSLVNQLIGTSVMLIALLVYQHYLTITVLAIPLILILQYVCFLGLGLIFATLHTYIRDIGTVVGIAAMLLMWMSPTLYPDTLFDTQTPSTALIWIEFIVNLNPLTYMVNIHHGIIIYNQINWLDWVVFGGFSVCVFALGYWIFTKCHAEFADLL